MNHKALLRGVKDILASITIRMINGIIPEYPSHMSPYRALGNET